MCKSKPRLFDVKGDYRSVSIVRRHGLEIVIPASLLRKKDNSLKLSVKKCLADLSKENIAKLESMGCSCEVLAVMA